MVEDCECFFDVTTQLKLGLPLSIQGDFGLTIMFVIGHFDGYLEEKDRLLLNIKVD